MAVAVIATDTWLSHLEFTGGRRQTEFGPIDGLFYGVVAVTGDATGGNATLNGNVSFDRKEDWVYLLKKISLSRTGVVAAGDKVFVVAATGPSIAAGGPITNPSFHMGGDLEGITNNDVSVMGHLDGAGDHFTDLPIFGDKKLAGPLSMVASGLENNVDAVVYQLSVYGWLIRYSSFFRNLGGSFG